MGCKMAGLVLLAARCVLQVVGVTAAWNRSVLELSCFSNCAALLLAMYTGLHCQHSCAGAVSVCRRCASILIVCVATSAGAVGECSTLNPDCVLAHPSSLLALPAGLCLLRQLEQDCADRQQQLCWGALCAALGLQGCGHYFACTVTVTTVLLRGLLSSRAVHVSWVHLFVAPVIHTAPNAVWSVCMFQTCCTTPLAARCAQCVHVSWVRLLIQVAPVAVTVLSALGPGCACCMGFASNTLFVQIVRVLAVKQGGVQAASRNSHLQSWVAASRCRLVRC